MNSSPTRLREEEVQLAVLEQQGEEEVEEMGARSWSAGGSSPTLQTARTPACLQSSSSSSVCPSPPAMTVQQPLSSSQSSSSSPTVTAWHNQRGCDRPSTKHHRKWPSAARPTATITDQQVFYKSHSHYYYY